MSAFPRQSKNVEFQKSQQIFLNKKRKRKIKKRETDETMIETETANLIEIEDNIVGESPKKKSEEINEGESESSEKTRVIGTKDNDDDEESERKGRKKKIVDNRPSMKIEKDKTTTKEIDDIKQALQQQEYKFENKINGLKNKINELKNKTNELENETNELKNETNELKSEIGEQNKKIYLLSEIYHESDKFSKKIENNLIDLRTQFNKVINTFKVLYIRKICNFIIKELINRYHDNIALTKYKFKNNVGHDFSLTVVLRDLYKISKKKITSLFDFLWDTQKNCSKLIHLNNVRLPIVKEIFYTLINKDIKDKKKDTLFVDISEMVKLLFEKMEDEKEGTSNKLNERIAILDKYIKEEEIKISEDGNVEININIKDDDDDDEETNYSQKMEMIMSGKYEGNITIIKLLKILKNKYMYNENQNKLLIGTNGSIEPEYFYNLWISSFTREGYKKSNKYKKYIDSNNLPSIKELKNMLITLLSGFKINFFDEDPSDLTQKIIYRIK